MAMSKRNKNLVIGFDLDGVIVDHTLPKISLAKKLGFYLKPEETPAEIIKKIIPEESMNKLQYYLYSDPELSLTSPLMAGVKTILQALKRKRIPYVLISRRRSAMSAVRLLEVRGLWPKYFDFENTAFVSEPEDKNVKAVEFGVTHYIDDELRVLEKLIDVRNRFLFDRHGVFPDKDFYKRLDSWSEFFSHL